MSESHYYNFYGGARQDKSTIDKWREDALNHLITNPEAKYYSVACGNAFLIALRHENGIDMRIVTEGYENYIYDL